MSMWIVDASTPQPGRWPTDATDLAPWIPYALESLVNTDLDAHTTTISTEAAHFHNHNHPLSLRSHVRDSVAAIAGWLVTRLPFATLRRDSDGQWMTTDGAARILLESGSAADADGLQRLRDTLAALDTLTPFALTGIVAADVLVLARANFHPLLVKRHAKTDGGLTDLRRWADAELTGPQWELALDAGMTADEIDTIITTGQFPDEDALEMLAAFHTAPATD